MRRFCYKCGALESEKGPLIRGLCQECFAAESPLLHAPNEISVKVCGRCGAYMVGREWQESEGDLKKALLNVVKDAVLSRLGGARLTPKGIGYVGVEEAEGIEVEVKPRLAPPEMLVEVLARGKLHEFQAEPQTARAKIKVELKQTTCDVCSRIGSGYYEAILQIRGEAELSARELSEIRRRLKDKVSRARERDREQFIAKTELKHGGMDLYVSSAKLARQMAATLKSEFGAEVKESAKLVGQDRSGRRKFRVSVLARVPWTRE